MTGRVVVRKSGSVREGGGRDSVVTRFSSVREHGSRDAYDRDGTNLPGLEVGATGSIFALVDHDVRSRDGFRSVAGRPSEQEISRSDRWWLLLSRGRSRRLADAVSDGNKKDRDDNRSLEAVDENGGKMPTWKRLLRKFKGEAKNRNGSQTKERLNDSQFATDQDDLHPSYGGEESENGQIQYESLRDKQETNGDQLQGDTQKPPIYFGSLPLPNPPRQEPQTYLWERRKVGQPFNLDLSKVRTPASRHARVIKAHPK